MGTFGFDSTQVRAHLEMLQGVIQPIAENSRYCKLWSITALSAVLFLSARGGVAWYTLIALAPLSFFLLLDVYYLTLERRFRGRYESMLEKLGSDAYGSNDAYQVAPVDFSWFILMKSLRSPLVYPYYPLAFCIALAVFAAQHLLGWG